MCYFQPERERRRHLVIYCPSSTTTVLVGTHFGSGIEGKSEVLQWFFNEFIWVRYATWTGTRLYPRAMPPGGGQLETAFPGASHRRESSRHSCLNDLRVVLPSV